MKTDGRQHGEAGWTLFFFGSLVVELDHLSALVDSDRETVIIIIIIIFGRALAQPRLVRAAASAEVMI